MKKQELLDGLVSLFTRLNGRIDKDKAKCCTCGKVMYWNELTNGHFRKRRHLATRFKVENCAAQCGICNGVKDGEYDKHADYIDKKHGKGVSDMLVQLSNTTVKYMDFEYDEMIDRYFWDIIFLLKDKPTSRPLPKYFNKMIKEKQ